MTDKPPKPYEYAYPLELPTIIVSKKELVNGQVIKENYIQIKGKTLTEAKKIYDKLRNGVAPR